MVIAYIRGLAANKWNEKHGSMTELSAIPIVEFETAQAFETWLERHYANPDGIWLKLFKNNS